MKNKKGVNLLIIGAMILLLAYSCKKDVEEQVIDVRDNFAGNWNVSDQILAKQNYQVKIYKDANNSQKVWLVNFHGTLDTAFAYIDVKTITISQQEIGHTHLTTAGSGLMTGTTKIDFQYYINDGAQQDTIIATYLK
jgi:hypothetical protein